MFQSFRLSMTWLHTWFGLVLGYVLMAAFFFGALSVFDREIDRWAIPETRFEPQPMPSFDRVLAPIFRSIEPEEEELVAALGRVGGPLPGVLPLMNWSAYTTHRDPVLSLFAEFAVTNNPNDPNDHVHGHVTIDPRSGRCCCTTSSGSAAASSIRCISASTSSGRISAPGSSAWRRSRCSPPS